MIEKYTEKAIKVLLFAQEEAFMAKHDKLYPEHLLLGIMREGSGLSAKLLKASGLEISEIRDVIHKDPTKNKSFQRNSESLPFSAIVQKILREAWYKVQSTGTYYVTPENLFLSLIKTKDSLVVNLLEDFDVNTEKIKSSIEKVSNKAAKPFVHPEETGNFGKIYPRNLDKSLLFENGNLEDVMQVAKDKIENTRHEAFGTEQLLQGLVESQNSWLTELLAGEGVTAESVEEKINTINSRKDEYNEDEPEFTPKAYKALFTAIEIAKNLGSTYVKQEHVLLGILKENKGIASKVFKELGINSTTLYSKVITPLEKEKPEAHTILRLAEEEARRMEQNIVGTEQILLGIIGEGTGIASHVLRNLEITLKDARAEVKKIIGASQNYSENNEIIYTPRAKRVIAQAWKKAKKLGKDKFTSEHLLLAITREKESIAMKVLENLGVDTVEIRQGIVNEIKNNAIPVNLEDNE